MFYAVTLWMIGIFSWAAFDVSSLILKINIWAIIALSLVGIGVRIQKDQKR